MVQTALNDPVAALEFDPAQRVQLLQSQTANQIDCLGGLLALATHSPLESRNEPCPRAAHLLGGHFPALQYPNLSTTAFSFASPPAALRRSPRGILSPP